MINYHSKLFKFSKVVKAPTVYGNGFPLPGIFSLVDIKYHINGLVKLKNELIEIEV